MLIRSCNGSVMEVPMDEATMTFFVRNAAMIKTHDVSPRMQEQNSSVRRLTATDIALYNANEDDLVQNTLASSFCDEMMSGESHRKNTTEKKAAIIHSMFKLANSRYQSTQQLHMSDKLRLGRTSQRCLEELSKYGMASSRKAVHKLLQVREPYP